MVHTSRSSVAGVLMRMSLLGMLVAPAADRAIAQQAPQTEPASPQAAAPVAQPAVDSELNGPWLRDRKGREYMVIRMPRIQGQKVDAGTIRTIFGLTLDLDHEDKDSFYYRYYKVEKNPTPNAVDAVPDAETSASIEAKYSADVPVSDVLSFLPFDEGLPQAGQWREGFAIADVNEDGHPDLVFGPPRKGFRGPSIYLGDGKGHWTLWREAKFPSRPYDYGTVAAGDFNGDHHVDLVFGVHLRGLIAMTGDGKGNFTDDSEGLAFSVPGRDAGASFSSQAIAVADWNGDHLDDIVALGEGPRLNLTPGRGGLDVHANGYVVYLSKGGAGWTRQNLPSGTRENFGQSISVADINGDGVLDLASGTSIMGRSDLVQLRGKSGALSGVSLDTRPLQVTRSVAVADVDRNGRNDLVVAYAAREGDQWRSGVDIYYQIDDGRWSRQTLTAVKGNGGPTAVAVGDLDGDGRADIVVGTAEGEIWTFLAATKTPFTREKQVVRPSFGACAVSALQLRDLDGDGRDEIVATFASETEANEPSVCKSEGGVAVWRTTGRRRYGDY